MTSRWEITHPTRKNKTFPPGKYPTEGLLPNAGCLACKEVIRANTMDSSRIAIVCPYLGSIIDLGTLSIVGDCVLDDLYTILQRYRAREVYNGH